MLDFKIYTIKHDKFDLYSFNKILQQSQQLKQLHESIDIPTAKPLIFDTFNAFFKYQPEFYPDEHIHPQYIINKHILQKAMQSQEYTKLRTITKLDEVNSAVATVAFVKQVISKILEDENMQEQLNELKQDFDALIKATLKNHPNAQQIQQKIQQKLQNIQKSISYQKINDALKSAREQTQEAQKIISAMWGHDPGELKKLNAQQRLALASALLNSDKLRKIAELLGRFKNIAISMRKQKIKSISTSGVAVGNDLARILPSELALLHINELEFLRKFVERQLLQYDIESKQNEGKGDFVVCLDLSGSMEGEREVWAKAVTLAVMHLAFRDRRNFALITFDSDVRSVYYFEKKAEPMEIVKIAEEFYGGGTSFAKPLAKAMEVMKNIKRSDILFITDGECNDVDEILDELKDFKKRHGVRIISVYVGDEGTKSLEKFSDVVVDVRDLDVKKVFETL